MNVSNPRRTLLQRAALVIAAAVAGGCGFRLRGAANIPFETVALQGAENTAFAVELRRSLLANRNVRIVDDPKLAQAILQIAGMSQERRILSLSGAGRVREFQLIFRVSYRVHDGKGRDLIAPGEVVLRRDITFDDSQVLAKEQEEILLVRDMQTDAVQQLLRRIAAASRATS
jgi:LPS-assembly lipoprotein